MIDRCMMLYVLIAVMIVKFHSSHEKDEKFFAVIVLEKKMEKIDSDHEMTQEDQKDQV